MNCLPFEERIAQYLDGGLDRAEVRLVEAHLRSCPTCAEFADQLEYDRILLRTQPRETAEVDFAALRGQIRQRIVQERRPKMLVPALLIAASILVAVGIAAIRFGAGRVPPVLVGQAPPATAPYVSGGADPVVRASATDASGNGIKIGPNARRPTRASAADQGVRPTAAPTPQADPALEAALREFVAAEKAPDVSIEAASPIEIRIVTGDPNVILILLQETNGVSNE